MSVTPIMGTKDKRHQSGPQLNIRDRQEEEHWSRKYVPHNANTETYPSINDWGGRGYDNFVPGEVTKTVPSGDSTS